MAKKTGKPASKSVSALDILLKGARQTVSTSTLSEQFSSVMSLANAGIPRLMEQNPQMHISEARDLHARAQAMSVVIARQFREQRLTASVRQANRPPTGIKGLVDGPTYTDMFNPDWANHCPPDAIEATTSPVAYLADLYRYAKDLEATGKKDEVITLDQRRPDLKDLVLDHTALNRVEPTIVLVNEILEKSIRTHLDGIGLDEKSVDDALLEARYPNALPFERYTSQINYALGRKDRTLGDVIRVADPAYPYFKEPGVHSLLSDTALIQDTGLGPVQQGLLLEAPYFPAADGAGHPLGTTDWRIDPRTHLMTKADADAPTTFYLDNFGVGGFIELEDTQTFCLRTGLSTEELEALLSVGAFAPSRSANVTGEGEVDASQSGSVYINAGQSPAMGIETLPADAEKSTGAQHRITHLTPDRVDRMNRMIRLARWLELPFDEVDQLLVASMQGERHAAQATRRVNAETVNPWLITENTLRALGLFQILRQQYDVAAEDFAALLYGLNVHGRGKTASQFDRVFNSQALFSIPLSLDGEPFTALPGTEAERQKIDHLCAALGMTFETWRYVARVVEQTYAGGSLRWSREVVSAFYRLVRLPRYVGLSTIEALALLELLDDGGSRLVAKLAGTTQIASHHASANTDTLSVIHALVDASHWVTEHRWSVAQLCRLVLPSATQPVATDAELGLLQQIQTRLRSALVTESSFAQVGAPDVSVTLEHDSEGVERYASQVIDWIDELNNFIDSGNSETNARGLVKYLPGETEESFESALSRRVELVIEAKGLSVAELHPKITNMIMRARGAQEALLMEELAGYLSTSPDIAKALLFWTDGDRFQLLKEVLRVFGVNAAGTVEIGDDVLLVLDALSKRSVLANHLQLSPTFITQVINHPDWFGVTSTQLSLPLVYFTSQYATLLQLSDQNEDTLLDYFRLIHSLWGGATDADKRLIRDSAASKLGGLLRWGVREVLEVVFALNTEGVVSTLKEFDTLARICLLGLHTGLDAKSLLVLGHLTPISPKEAYQQAAEMALVCLAQPLPTIGAGEVGQSISSVINVQPDYLVANRPEDSATFTISLRDSMDEPFEGITVRWSSNLGELDVSQTLTDQDGLSSVVLHSGTTMGVANVEARYGLGELLKAPVVAIDCDEDSIHFIEGAYEPSSALSNKLEPIYFSVSMVDDYGNKANDRMVEWVASLGEFQRYQTITDGSGFTRAELRSKPAGTAHVIAHYRNHSPWVFRPVEFISKPYFQYVRFLNTVLVGEEVDIECRLVELDGSPVAEGTEVKWSADKNSLLTSASATDSEGRAVAVFKASVSGVVVITAKSEGVEDKSSEQTQMYEQVKIVRAELSSDRYTVGSPDPIVFSVFLEVDGQIPPRTPVQWSIDGVQKAETYSAGITGKAEYSSKFALGEHEIIARVGKAEKSFTIFAGPWCTLVGTLEGPRDELVPDLLTYGAEYKLHIKALDDGGNPIPDTVVMLESIGAAPELIGVNINDIDQWVSIPSEGKDFVISTGSFHSVAWTMGKFGKLDLRVKSLNGEPLEVNYRKGVVMTLGRAWHWRAQTDLLGQLWYVPLGFPSVISGYDSERIAVERTNRITVPAVGFSVEKDISHVLEPTSTYRMGMGYNINYGPPKGAGGIISSGDLVNAERVISADGYIVIQEVVDAVILF
ncbi:Tc toxin subunit A [Pseudomonas sp. UBA1879]|uniref:Tc toxin subunit A n=1 Tax=Pseudomonas sp. UBA1879 TaxID=1947305 RepID=UPI0025D00E92|nr:Tc toxin subunit A [Pseudomonas sp. UBA1879]